MIIISCPNCGKPIELNHAYKISDGAAAHVNCEAPVAVEQEPKVISFVSSKH